jgi:membrane fusion protein (multidrug efflux system)
MSNDIHVPPASGREERHDKSTHESEHSEHRDGNDGAQGHGSEHHDKPHLPQPNEHPRAVRILLISAIAVVIVLVVAVVTSRVRAAHKGSAERQTRTAELAKGPKLTVVKVEGSRTERDIQLPAEVRGYRQITLYPKISGYVADVRFERGDRVKKGQILAVIESPETDQSMLSARSDAITKRLNAQRANALTPSGVISEMDRDNASAAAKIADAELRRAAALKKYEVVTAPFDGVASARYVDPGALLPAGTASGMPIADLADIDRVRVFIYLGQDTALFASVGDKVLIWDRERPEKRLNAAITRCGKALDPRTRTMTCEIEMDNRENGLFPGSFVQVELHQHLPPRPTIPTEAVLVRGGESMVALVDGNHVHLQTIVLGDNDGRTIRVERGLSGGETIGLGVPIEIEEGAIVQPVLQQPKPASSAESGVGGGPAASSSAGAGQPPAPSKKD